MNDRINVTIIEKGDAIQRIEIVNQLGEKTIAITSNESPEYVALLDAIDAVWNVAQP